MALGHYFFFGGCNPPKTSFVPEATIVYKGYFFVASDCSVEGFRVFDGEILNQVSMGLSYLDFDVLGDFAIFGSCTATSLTADILVSLGISAGAALLGGSPIGSIHAQK